jgi:hypothetical protein
MARNVKNELNDFDHRRVCTEIPANFSEVIDCEESYGSQQELNTE